MNAVLLAKGLADFTFAGALLWYVVKYIAYMLVIFCAVMLGIQARKAKNKSDEKKSQAQELEQKDNPDGNVSM